MKLKIAVALILIGAIIPFIILGGYPIAIVIFIAAAISLFEAITARHESKKWPVGIKIFIIIVGLLMIFWNFLLKLVFQEYQLDFAIGAMLPTLGVISAFLILFLMTIIYKEFEVSDATYVFTLLMFITLGSQSLCYLSLKHQFHGITDMAVPLALPERLMPVLFVLSVTYMTDTGGYIIGYFFGKKKINPRISPKKTVEGFIGATSFGIAASFLFAFIPALQLTYYTWWGTILLGIGLAFGAQLGDFMFSAIKRHYHIKDFGVIFPGHGGMLDRIDSLLVNGMIFMLVDVLVVRYHVSGYADFIKYIVELFTR